MAFTRNQAKMIAEELYKIIRGDIIEATKEANEVESEEFISLKEAAQMLSMSPSSLYKKKDMFGCYTKVSGRIRFAKRKLANTYMRM